MVSQVLSEKSFFATLKSAWQSRLFRFIDRRAVVKPKQGLTSKNLYIFPSGRGFLFLLIVLILWLLGTNYQNNLILGLAFFLASLFNAAIINTYKNMSALSISYQGAAKAFAGEEVMFRFMVDASAKRRVSEYVEFRWQNSDTSVPYYFDAGGEHNIQVPLRSTKRGWLTPERLLIETYYPFGLLRCWTWLRWDASALVYPAPLETPMPANAVIDENGDGEHPLKGGDDYTGLRPYKEGDSLKHVAWKPYARDKGLFTKEFSQNLSRELWLDYDGVQGADVEQKLSGLCYWALQYHQQDEHYGLKLPGSDIPLGKGENHQVLVLSALATFGTAPQGGSNA